MQKPVSDQTWLKNLDSTQWEGWSSPNGNARPRQWSKPLLYQRNISLPTASLLLSFSTRWKSAHLRVGQSLNPYPVHYRQAFACSSVLYRQTHWRPLRLAVSARQRDLPAYHVSDQHRFGWLRFRLFAGGAPSATDDFIAPVPDPLPFGSSLSASLACCS